MIFILDIDGTLIDSFERHYLLLNKLLIDNNVTKKLDKNEYINFKKNGGNNYNYMIEKMKLNIELAIKIKNEWIKNIEDKKWIIHDILYKDTLPFLENLKNNNIKIYFLSSRSNETNLIEELDILDIKKYADEIFVVDVINQIENKKKKIQYILNNNDNCKIICVGDTEIDYYSALYNNVDYYILNRGFRSKEYLDKLNINTFNDLEQIFLEVKL